MNPYNLLIRFFVYIIPIHAIRLYTTIFEKFPTPLCKSIHSVNQLQSDSIDYTLSFQKYTLIEWIHTVYWSAVSFTSDLSLLSDSTLLFSKISHPTVQIHTFHQSAAIWFYWLYTIIKKYPLVERFYTINKSTVSFTSYLYISFRQFLLQSLTWQV